MREKLKEIMPKRPQTEEHAHAVHVTDAGDLRKWRTELPNLIDDLDLSLFAYRLYGHLKRRAGATGSTIEGLRAMARHCKMAVGTAAKARRELLDLELIATEEIVNDKGRFERITIIDIWQENFAHYAEKKARKSKLLSDGVCHQTTHPGVSPDDTPGVSSNPQGVLPITTPPVSSGDTLKKEPREERTFEERKHTHGAPAPPGSGKAKVCVCETPHRSKLCDEERIKIASNMPGIKFPERYAMTLEARRGTYDAAFLKRQKELKRPEATPAAERDTSACPDCKGSGFSYPNGPTGGVKKCKHSRLDEEIERKGKDIQTQEALSAK